MKNKFYQIAPKFTFIPFYGRDIEQKSAFIGNTFVMLPFHERTKHSVTNYQTRDIKRNQHDERADGFRASLFRLYIAALLKLLTLFDITPVIEKAFLAFVPFYLTFRWFR